MECQEKKCTGCGGSECCKGCGQPTEIRLTRAEAAFLLRFAELPFLPAARFWLRRMGGSAQEGDSLEPVFLCSPSDSLKTVRKTASLLEQLAVSGLISVSYTEPLSHFNYAEYVNAPAFLEFCAQATGFSIPEVMEGSMALTALGQEVIDDLELSVLPRKNNL